MSRPAEARLRKGEARPGAHRAARAVDGIVTNRQVQVGQRIAAGAPIMVLVPISTAYVDANFKESQFKDIRIGQPVELVSDYYGGGDGRLRGKVVGGRRRYRRRLSLIPAQNATGNWVKVVQRLPVRIALDPKQLKEHPLRVGLLDGSHDRHARSLSMASAALPASAISGRAATADRRAADRRRLRARARQFRRGARHTIANVSVPHIAGGLAVSPTQGTVGDHQLCGGRRDQRAASTGWLAMRFGTVRWFMISIIGFGIFSFLCGVSRTLDALVLFRVLGGSRGGPLMPLSHICCCASSPGLKRPGSALRPGR